MIPTIRNEQVNRGQLSNSTIPVPIIQSTDEDDINIPRRLITNALVTDGFTDTFVTSVLNSLDDKYIYLAALHLPQIITKYSPMEKDRIRVRDMVRFIISLDKKSSYIPSGVTSRREALKPLYSHPDETDIIALKSAICLAKWQVNISTINIATPRPQPPFGPNQIARTERSRHPLKDYSDNFIEEIGRQPYGPENFYYLLSFAKLPLDKLQDIYNKTIRLKDGFSTFTGEFSVSQDTNIRNLMKANGGRKGDAQDAYLKSIDDVARGIFSHEEDGNKIYSSPRHWGWTRLFTQTQPGEDVPWGNFRSDIVELVLERIECFISFFNELDPTLQRGLFGGKKKNVKIITKKRKYKQRKTKKRKYKQRK